MWVKHARFCVFNPKSGNVEIDEYCVVVKTENPAFLFSKFVMELNLLSL